MPRKIIRIDPNKQRLEPGDKPTSFKPKLGLVGENNHLYIKVKGNRIRKDKLINTNGELYPIKKPVRIPTRIKHRPKRVVTTDINKIKEFFGIANKELK